MSDQGKVDAFAANAAHQIALDSPLRADPDEVEARVERGTESLDNTMPGWWEKVDLSTLDISSCSRCVLGQVFKTHVKDWQNAFNYGRDVLCEGSHQTAVADGFSARYWSDLGDDVSDVEGVAVLHDEWAQLHTAWHHVIEARQEASR